MTGRDLIWLVCGLVVVVGLVNNPDKTDELTMQAKTYCDMVQTYKETKGQYGWPDYRGNFRKVCK